MFHLHPLELTVSTFFPSITIPAGIYSPYLFYQLCFPATLFPYRIHPTAFHIHLFPLQKLLSVSGRGLPVLSAYAHIQQKLLHILLFSVIPAAVIDHLSERIVFRQVLFYHPFTPPEILPSSTMFLLYRWFFLYRYFSIIHALIP